MGDWYVQGCEAFVLSGEVVSVWHETNPDLDWTVCAKIIESRRSEIARLVEHLALINCFQWHLEDESRATTDLAAAGRLKQEIDRSNQRRVDQINVLNRYCFERLPTSQPTAPVLTESPGSIYDRLTILALKADHAELEDQVQILQEEASDLAEGLDQMFKNLETGSLRMKLYTTLKIYER